MDVQTMTAQDAPARPRTGPGRIPTLVVMGVTGALILAVAFIANQPAAGTADGSVTSVTLSGTATGEAPVVGRVAPDFTATAADGTTFRLSDLRGRPVWLTFGASWCQPCRAENPDIQAAYEKASPGGLAVVQVYMSEGVDAVTEYADRVGLTYTKIPDPNERLANEYRILGIPTHYFIDAQGVLRQLKIGSLDPAAMEAAVKGIGG